MMMEKLSKTMLCKEFYNYLKGFYDFKISFLKISSLISSCSEYFDSEFYSYDLVIYLRSVTYSSLFLIKKFKLANFKVESIFILPYKDYVRLYILIKHKDNLLI